MEITFSPFSLNNFYDFLLETGLEKMIERMWWAASNELICKRQLYHCERK